MSDYEKELWGTRSGVDRLEQFHRRYEARPESAKRSLNAGPILGKLEGPARKNVLPRLLALGSVTKLTDDMPQYIEALKTSKALCKQGYIDQAMSIIKKTTDTDQAMTYIDLLLQAGFDVTAENRNGQSLMTLALQARSLPLVEFLIQRGAWNERVIGKAIKLAADDSKALPFAIDLCEKYARASFSNTSVIPIAIQESGFIQCQSSRAWIDRKQASIRNTGLFAIVQARGSGAV